MITSQDYPVSTTKWTDIDHILSDIYFSWIGPKIWKVELMISDGKAGSSAMIKNEEQSLLP